MLARADEPAEAGIVLVTGAGFDVVPTDCLATLLPRRCPTRPRWSWRSHAPGGVSRGTATTGLAMDVRGRLACGSRGTLVPTRFGAPARDVPFPSKVRRVGSVPWGDLVTATTRPGSPTSSSTPRWSAGAAR